MRWGVLVLLVAVLAAPGVLAAGRDIPLPRPRPADIPQAGEAEPAEPSACQARLAAGLAIARALPPIEGPGACGGTDIVLMEAIVLADQGRIAMSPPATLRCSLAELVASWVRDQVAPTTARLGAPLRAIENDQSYDCRGRNRIAGAKLSEHGRANALDIKGIRLGDGRIVSLADFAVDRGFRDGMRRSACERFTTVLGPGSDGYHENHIHVDLAERRGGYRICQWDLEPPKVAAETAEPEIPLPRPRPAVYNEPARPPAVRPGRHRHDRAQ